MKFSKHNSNLETDILACHKILQNTFHDGGGGGIDGV